MRRWKNVVPQFRIPALIVMACATVFLSGCGSSGPSSSGGSSSSGSSTGSYSLSLSASSLTLSTSDQTLTVTLQPVGGFNGSVNCTLSNVPAGVVANPSSFSLSGTGSQQIKLSLGTGAVAGTSTVTINGTGAGVSKSASFQLTLNPPPSGISLSLADQLVRVDTLTPYLSFPEPNYLLYHSATNRFFSTDAFLNRLYVIDAASRTLTATLTIPGAFGIDQAPDGSVIYVGTMVGDLYVVDPVNLTILQRYASSTISPYGFLANAVYALADGKLILEQYNLLPGFSWVDGNGPLALWDPKTNDITEFIGTSSLSANGAIPQKPSCLQNFEQVILTNNRTRVLLVPVLTSQGSAVLCSLDPEADTWNWSQQITGGSGSALSAFAISSDGNTLAAYDGYDIYSLDPATFAVKSSFSVPTAQGLFTYPVLLLSRDNQSAFITDSKGADVFDEYNLATGKLTGWISQLNLASPESYTPIQPFYQAIASNGLAAGVIEGGGIGLLDTTAVQAPPIGSRFTQTQLSVPFGPTGGGTAESWLPSYTPGPTPPPFASVYFGTNTASDVNNDGSDAYIDAVTPAGNAGVVDVRTFATDGGSQLIPDGFSYGPSVLEAPTTYSTAEGGGLGDLFGYGFGPQVLTNSQLYVSPPSDLQVTVGGAPAPIGGYSPDPYGGTYFTAPVFPSNALQYTIPPGTAGATSAIAVSNSSGTTTATQAMNYLPAIQQYPVSGQLADGVYDPVRDVYYFTDATQVRVFSLTQGAWLPSIPIPAPTGAYGAQRFYSLAISPDGSKLAVSDPGAIAIYVIDLNQISSIQSFAYASQVIEPITREPAGVAITNNGTVYFVTFDLDGDGGSGYLYALNPSTGRIAEVTGGNVNESTYLPTEGPVSDGRLVTTEDGSRIYFNDAGILGWIDTTTGTFLYAPYNNDSEIGQDDYEIVMGANQTRLFAEGFFDDSNFNSIGFQAINIAESLDASYVYGAAFSADGSLFFQPGTQAIDVFDGRTGAFRARIALPVQLSPNFRALVSSNHDSRLVAITGTTGDGIAVINLNSLPEPATLPWLSSEVRPLSSARPYRPVQKIKISPNPFVRIHRQGNSRLVRLLKESHRRPALPVQAKRP